MDGLISLFYILCIVWSILCLILFFKIWGMTNNVEQLTREVHELRNALYHHQYQNSKQNLHMKMRLLKNLLLI